MDVNLIRIGVTVLAMAAFLGIVWWAYSPRRARLLDEQGRRIVEDES